jgi:lipopolysaccharide transport system ATP-binding protein
MGTPAVSVEGIGKMYRIAHEARATTVREAVVNLVMAPIKRYQRLSEHGGDMERFWAVRNVSFEIQPGEVVGIIGRNGAGKSTLLKLLSRIAEPTEGIGRLRGRVASLLEVGTGFHPELTGRENIYLNGSILGMKRSEIRKRFDEIVAFAEVEKFLDTPVKRYSSGMYVRLAFGVAAHLEPEILIVDEVLAVGDGEFQKKCLGKMRDSVRSGERTVIFVSHNLAAVSNLCQRALVMAGGSIRYDGSAEDAVHYYLATFGQRAAASADDPHVLYHVDDRRKLRSVGDSGQAVLTKVELLDTEGSPKPTVSTWEDLVLRFHYDCESYVERAAVDFEISSTDGARIMRLSTQPDGTLPLTFTPGQHSVDCTIRGLPLTAGDYLLTASLSVPGVRTIWGPHQIGSLTVGPRDVYGSGLSPTASRCAVAVDHDWCKVERGLMPLTRVPPVDVRAG